MQSSTGFHLLFKIGMCLLCSAAELLVKREGVNQKWVWISIAINGR